MSDDGTPGGWGAFAAPAGTAPAPPTAAPPTAPSPTPIWKLVVAPVLALVAAVAAGFAVGVGVFYASGGGNASDQLSSLGPALLAFGAGILIGAAAAVALLVAAARRVVPPGRRAGAVAGSLLAFPLAVMLLGVLAGSVREGTWPIRLGDGLVQVALLLAPSTAFLVAARGASARPRAGAGRRDPGAVAGLVALVLVGALVASAVVLSVAGRGVARTSSTKTLGSLPYVLFRPPTGGQPAPDPGVAGWRWSPEKVAFVSSVRPDEQTGGQVGAADIGLRYFLAGYGLASVQMYSQLRPCVAAPVRGLVCRVEGATAAGELRLYLRTPAAGAGALNQLALAFPDGSGVTVSIRSRGDGGDGLSGPTGADGQATARTVLDEVVRVSRSRFEAATGTTVKTY